MQRYKCVACGKQFLLSYKIESDINDLWKEYLQGKQTYKQLACKYSCSVKTIQRKIGAAKAGRQTTFPNVVNVLMDTTYFGRKLGVMVFKDSLSGQILYKQYVKQETNKLYLAGIEEIARRGIRIQAVICDGRKALLQLLEGYSNADVPFSSGGYY